MVFRSYSCGASLRPTICIESRTFPELGVGTFLTSGEGFTGNGCDVGVGWENVFRVIMENMIDRLQSLLRHKRRAIN